MANLYKPRYTKRDPETGERVTRVVRKWYGRYEDENGILKQMPLCEDKQSAQAMLTDVVRRIDRIRSGIVDPLSKHLSAAISDHVDDFRSHLTAKARSESHINETTRLIDKIVDKCRLSLLSELQAADGDIERYITSRRQAGLSHRTINADLTAIKAFCRWLVRRNRMMRDPTTALEPLNIEEDRRLRRRALSEEEAGRLLAATLESEKVFRCLTGQDRAMLYLLSQTTGLRRGELKSLTPSAFDFSTTPAVITIKAANSKRRQQEHIPLPDDVAEYFQEYLADKKPNEPVWRGSWWRRSAEMIRLDLDDAGIPIEDEQGRVIDFHGQRTTFITNLSRAGVTPAVVQKLARHSDVRLTLGTYTQMDMKELGAAVSKLPQLTPKPGKPMKRREAQEIASQGEELMECWPQLSTDIRQQILAVAREALADGA